MKFNFISNVDLKEISGGWSGLNSKVFHGLSQELDLEYTGPLEVKVNNKEVIFSRILRLFNIRGNYYFYSESRLKEFSKLLTRFIKKDEVLIFFGSTRWIKSKPKNKYFIIMDIPFLGYYEYYNEDKYKKSDIRRIAEQEKEFIQNAEHVFFTSQWSIEITKRYYNLDGSNMQSVGIGANVEGFFSEEKTKTNSFLYISHSFEAKGGYELYEAFKRFYVNDSSSKLTIIGGEPSKEVINHPGVEYIGYIDKSIPAEYNKYIKIVSSSSLLVVPTKGDVAPVALIDCGYFGTPTIAPGRFAIPEMIIHQKTGYLLKEDFSPLDILNEMEKFAKLSLKERNAFRKATYDHFQVNNNWQVVINKISSQIKASLNNA